MPRIDPTSGTSVMLTEATFHVGAVSRRRDTALLAPPVRTLLRALKTARDRAENAKLDASEKFGGLICGDFDVDDRIRILDLDVLKKVKKKRNNEAYRRVFPKGLGYVLALRGAAEEHEVKVVLDALRRVFPDLAAEYADLPGLAAAATAAEQEWTTAQREAGRLFTEETIVRGELIRQLQKNEGALIAIFPGQKARVRSFFRTARRSGKGASPAAGAP